MGSDSGFPPTFETTQGAMIDFAIPSARKKDIVVGDDGTFVDIGSIGFWIDMCIGMFTQGIIEVSVWFNHLKWNHIVFHKCLTCCLLHLDLSGHGSKDCVKIALDVFADGLQRLLQEFS